MENISVIANHIWDLYRKKIFTYYPIYFSSKVKQQSYALPELICLYEGTKLQQHYK